MLQYLTGKKTEEETSTSDVLPGEETPTEEVLPGEETPTEEPKAMNTPPPNVGWSSTGAVSIGLVDSLMGPVDGGAIAPVWTNTSGFTGTPVVSGAETRIFGNIISCTFKVAGITAAAGNNVANISLPHAVNGGTFTRGQQGGAQVSGLNATTGQALIGNARSTVGAASLAVSLYNGDLNAQAMDGGICVFCVYCLV